MLHHYLGLNLSSVILCLLEETKKSKNGMKIDTHFILSNFNVSNWCDLKDFGKAL